MTIYILPENRDKFSKLVARASKHLESAPKITYSEPVEKTKITRHVWNDEDGCGVRKFKEVVTVIVVTIDEITSGDWVLVADVLFNESIVTMENAKYYGAIPAVYGLHYFKCDYCGHTHNNRAKSHIVYNTKTGEWKQIGTSCGKKMFKGGDICAFSVKLNEIIDISGGCFDYGFADWCNRVPEHSWKIAYSIDDIISRVVEYRKTISTEWEKAEKVDRGTWVGGSTNKLLEMGKCEPANTDYINAVKAFVGRLEGKKVVNFYGEIGDDFNGKIKTAFDAGYILKADFYTVFFAVKMYEDSISSGDWEKQVSVYKVGEKYAFVGCELITRDEYEDVYGRGWYCKFKTTGGIVITKTFSNWDGFESQFKNDNDTYSFKARVDYINAKNHTVKLGGRVSKL